MMFVKETVRSYVTEQCANQGVGALKRFGWQIKGVPTRVELAKGKATWEVRAVKGVAVLIKLYDAYMAARRVFARSAA